MNRPTRTLAAATALFLAATASPASAADPAPLLEADRAFARMAQEKGVGAAFGAYAANPSVKFDHPKVKITPDELAATFPPETKLDWEPVEGDMAASGDLGYTWGRWTATVPAKDGGTRQITGKYVSIWKKQPDGSWKFVLDTGSPDPAPAPAAKPPAG